MLTGIERLQFLTSQLGWVILAAPGDNADVLFATTDGGHTWAALHAELVGE